MNDEDADLLERSEAIASDTSPEAQADVTEPAEVCTSPKLTVGMFFNGTVKNALTYQTTATRQQPALTAAPSLPWFARGV